MIYNLPRVDFHDQSCLTVKDIGKISEASMTCFALGRKLYRKGKSLRYAENYARKHDRDPGELIRGYEWQEVISRKKEAELLAEKKAKLEQEKEKLRLEKEKLRLEQEQLAALRQKQEAALVAANEREFRNFIWPVAAWLEKETLSKGHFWTNGPNRILYHVSISLRGRMKCKPLPGGGRVTAVYVCRVDPSLANPGLDLHVEGYAGINGFTREFHNLTLEQVRAKLGNILEGNFSYE